MDSPSTPGAPLFALTFSHASQTACFDISNGLPGDFSSPARLLPELLADRANTATNDPAPSLRPHYRDLSATTSRSASASRDGTQPLTASAPPGALPLTRPASAGRAVPGHAFSCSARKPQTGLASPACRPRPGQSADPRQAHPEVARTPRF